MGREAGYDVATELRHGDPARAVTAAVADRDPGLLVVGRPRPAAGGHRTARRIVEATDRPTVVVPAYGGSGAADDPGPPASENGVDR
jgi:F420-dependent methylenetetrahydromethanopterin dehydrogenase